MEEKDPLTHAVIGAAIEVHREMGPGLLQSVYQRCLEHELKLRNLPFKPQVRLPLVYKDMILDDEFILDIFFPRQLVVELKAVETTAAYPRSPTADVLAPQQNPRWAAY